MVLAVAALLLQIAPATPSAPVFTKISANAAVSASSAAVRTTEDANSGDAGMPASAPARPDTDGTVAKLVTVSANGGGNASLLPAEPRQNTQSLANIRIPPLKPEKRMEVPSAERPAARRQWLMLAIAQSGAATFDAYTTRQSIATGAVEKDPMMRPFANSAAIYGVIQVAPVALDYLSHRMQRSSFGFERRMWWLPQSIGTATFIFSGVHNIGVANR